MSNSLTEIKVKHLCAYCIFHPATCKVETEKDGIEFNLDEAPGDAVIKCDNHITIPIDKMNILRKCLNVFKKMTTTDKILLRVDDDNISKMVQEIFLEMYKKTSLDHIPNTNYLEYDEIQERRDI
jgi:hypothetical protein